MSHWKQSFWISEPKFLDVDATEDLHDRLSWRFVARERLRDIQDEVRGPIWCSVCSWAGERDCWCNISGGAKGASGECPAYQHCLKHCDLRSEWLDVLYHQIRSLYTDRCRVILMTLEELVRAVNSLGVVVKSYHVWVDKYRLIESRDGAEILLATGSKQVVEQYLRDLLTVESVLRE